MAGDEEARLLHERRGTGTLNEIFISYDSADRAVAQKFADALESFGWSIWWDREIPLGKSFDQVIEEELNAARCVVVLWTKNSVRSRWVKAEASAAAERERLLPVLLDDAAIPLEFNRIQTAMLGGWEGDRAHPEFERLVEAVEQMVGQPSPTPRDSSHRREEGTKPKKLWQTTPGRLGLVAAAVVIIAGLIVAKNALQDSWQAVPPPTNDAATNPPLANGSATSSQAVSPVASGAKTASPKGAFAVKVGDKIGDGVPGPGSGSIETPYQQGVYVFTATPGQRVYFRVLSYSPQLSSTPWRLTDADGTEIFDLCLGCTEVGVQTLRKGGPYTLTVGNDRNAATGVYQLQLFNVPPPNQFAIKIGDAIKDNAPGPGAGAIESPGADDIYTFTAAARQRVYFRMLEHSNGMAQIKWRLTDGNDMEVFDTCLGCSEPGLQILITGGSYKLTVGNPQNPATGTYRLQLYNVPPPKQFSIRIGDKIKPGVPGAGAGVIETPGAENIYTFTAARGQKVYFHLLDHDRGMEQIQWRLSDENGMEVFNTCLGCTAPGVQALTRGGTYTLTVGNHTHPATGNYAFEIGAR